MRRVSVALVFGLFFVLVLPVQAQDRRCFTETGQCISGRIRAFWDQNGGLPVFGFPTTDQHEEQVEGKSFQVQWFERNRLELHPENARPYDVLLGRLGVDRLQQQGRDWFTFPKADPATPHYYTQTEHAIAPQFWDYFRAHGLEFDGRRGTSEAESLALFGQPIAELAMETNASGATVLTQWFERARFESHPENQPPFNVLLGLLGNEIRVGSGGLAVVRSSAEIVAAFRAAGLEAENPHAMTRQDYGVAPFVCEGTRFFIPSLGEGNGGRAFYCANQKDLNRLKTYYETLGKESAILFSWVFTTGPLLVQVNGDLPEDQARRYEATLHALKTP
jgi:hypothetical protein